MADNDADTAGRRAIPEISTALIDWLVATHPQRVVAVGETMEQAQRRAGFQECIELLTVWAARQEAAKTDSTLAAGMYYDEEDDGMTVELNTVERLAQPRPPRR